MANQDVFGNYLEFRTQRANALTPGQKLEVVETLLKEAREEGKVPSSATSVTRLPVTDPVVQAALRGEDVSVGAVSISGKQENDWRDITTWTTSRKLLVIAAIVVAFMALAAATMRSSKAAAPEATATLEPSPTPDWYATMTAIASLPTEEPPAPPAPPPTPTMAFLLGQGGPAEDSRDPASIEIAGRLFIVSRGQVAKEDGKWIPQGPEWLPGTEVRRVFSIPYSGMADAEVKAGDPIAVRTRGGQVLNYKVRDVVRLLANQIETFISLRPSIVVVLPSQPGDVQTVERIVLFGEAQEEVALVEENAPSSALAPNAYTLSGVNLRDAPGMTSNVLVGMPPGTALVTTTVTPVQADWHLWLYVLSPYGYGWVARDVIVTQQ